MKVFFNFYWITAKLVRKNHFSASFQIFSCQRFPAGENNHRMVWIDVVRLIFIINISNMY